MQPGGFLPARFLFLVLRYYDESSFSSYTSCVCLGGAGPLTAASLRLPQPPPFVVWAQRCRSEQRRGCLPAPQLEPLWAGDNLGDILAPAYLVLTQTQACVAVLEGRMEKEP